MAYLRTKSVKGRPYYQIVEAYREGGRNKQRVLVHLGKVSHYSLLKWWEYLGRPGIPYKAGVPLPFSKVAPSLATPCETIVDLDKFLSWSAPEPDLGRIVEGLKFLTE